jgi:hypothetical protein
MGVGVSFIEAMAQLWSNCTVSPYQFGKMAGLEVAFVEALTQLGSNCSWYSCI